MLRGFLRDAAWVGSISKLNFKRSGKRLPLARAVNAAVESLEGRTLMSAGQPDPTFGNNGQVLLPPNNHVAYASALQSDGKLVIVGSAPGITGSGSDFFVERLNADGSADSSFGTSGIWNQHYADTATATAVAIQNDGKVLVGGVETSSTGVQSFALLRLNTNGTFDSTFGASGSAEFGFFASLHVSAGIGSIALLPNGEFLAVGRGTVTEETSSAPAFVAARFQANGQVDTTFNVYGYAVQQLPSSSNLNETRSNSISIANGPNGTYYVGTSYQIDPAVWRFKADGSLDTSWGLGGIAWTPMEFGDTNDNYVSASVSQVIVQPDGKVLVAGQDDFDGGSGDGWMVARYNANGTVDTTFGNTSIAPGKGAVHIALSVGSFDGSAPNMALQSDGKILVGGYNGEGAEAEVHRLTASGQADASFTPAVIQIDTGGALFGSGLSIKSDGKVILVFNAGSSVAGSQIDVLRLQNSISGTPPVVPPPTQPAPLPGQLNQSFGVQGRAVLPDPNQNWVSGQQVSIAASAVQSDGKVVMVGNYTRVIRLNADGTRDTAFEALWNHSYDALQMIYSGNLTSVIIQPDGKILVGGSYLTQPGAEIDTAFYIARLNSNGSIDTTFGTGGVFKLGFVGFESIESMALYANGDIVAVGNENPDGDTPGNSGFHILRLSAAGKLESGFNGTGIVSVDFGKSLVAAYPATVALQSDGKILVGDRDASGAALYRFNQDGSADTSFGTNGIARNSDPDQSGGSITALAVLSSGKILAATAGETGLRSAEIVRFTAAGAVDSTFTAGYASLLEFENNSGADVVMLSPQSNGSIIVAGSQQNLDQGQYAIGRIPLLVRLNADGSVDSAFKTSVDPMLEPEPYLHGQVVKGASQKADGSVFLAADVYADNTQYISPHVVGVADFYTGTTPVVRALPASTISGAVIDPPTTPTNPTNPSNPTTPSDPTTPTDPATPTDPSNPTSPSDPTQGGGTPVVNLPDGQLTCTVVSATPVKAIAGTKGVMIVKIKNTGAAWSGPVTIDVYASTDSTLGILDTRLANLNVARLVLKAGKTTNVRVPFVFSTDLSTARYTLLASVTESSAGTAAYTAAAKRAVALTAATVDLSVAFNTKKLVKLKSGKPNKLILLVKNLGNVKAVGMMNLALTGSTLGVIGELLAGATSVAIKLAPKATQRVTLAFTPPADLGATFSLDAAITSSTSPADANAANDAAEVAAIVK